jgi:hypothetical protein
MGNMVASAALVKRDGAPWCCCMVRACSVSDTMGATTTGDHTMTSTALSDTNMRLCYLATELGENLTIEAGGTTVHSKLARNGATVLAPGTSVSTAKTHCVSVDKTITSAP